jgi:hypothetical protein
MNIIKILSTILAIVFVEYIWFKYLIHLMNLNIFGVPSDIIKLSMSAGFLLAGIERFTKLFTAVLPKKAHWL